MPLLTSFFFGWVWVMGWGVRRFHDYIYMFSNPTEFCISHTRYTLLIIDQVRQLPWPKPITSSELRDFDFFNYLPVITSKPGMNRILPGEKNEDGTIRLWCAKTRAARCCCCAVSAYISFISWNFGSVFMEYEGIFRRGQGTPKITSDWRTSYRQLPVTGSCHPWY